MPSYDIIPLRCPSCGAVSSSPARPVAFGAELRCVHCQALSILVLHRDLVLTDALQKSGEQVCGTCGELARKDARFCQQGHPLVQTCLACASEFPAHHQRCDHCGRLQSEVRLEVALQKVAEVEASKIPEARVPVRGQTAEQLRAALVGLQRSAVQAVWIARGVKLALFLVAVLPLFDRSFLQLLPVLIGWKLCTAWRRRRQATLDEVVSQHRQAVAVVERNTRIDLAIAEARAEVELLRGQLA